MLVVNFSDQLLLLECLRGGGLGTKLPRVTGEWTLRSVGEVFGTAVRLFQTVTAADLNEGPPTSGCLSLFSLTSPDVAGRCWALMLPVRWSMLGRKNRCSEVALADLDTFWKQLELLERIRCGGVDAELLRVLEDSLLMTDDLS